MIKIGFILNPYSGLGGLIGFKGSDGIRELLPNIDLVGGRAVSRARSFLDRLSVIGGFGRQAIFVAPRGYMGGAVLRESGLRCLVIDYPDRDETISMDTVLSVSRLVGEGVELIVFVGGDGTAKDIYIGLRHYGDLALPVLGIPSGVKMFSGVFSNRPADAANLIQLYLSDQTQLVDGDVVDVDEYAYRGDVLRLRYYGSLKVVYASGFIQPSKDIGVSGSDEDKYAIARNVVESMEGDALYILGPGSTVKAVADILGVEKTLLGVDVYSRNFYMKDLAEPDLWRVVNTYNKIYLLLSPIGRQGFILGRGNLQISPRVLRRIGRDNIIVLATRRKLNSIEGGVLRIDTGDQELDELLRGFYKVIVGYGEYRFVKAV